MTAKDFLKRYNAINTEINAMLDEQKRLRTLAERVSPSLTEQGGHSGSISDRVGINAAKIADLETRINAKIDELVNVRYEIENAINAVEKNTLRTLLRLRYLSGMTWEQIACIMHYDYRHVLRLHGSALLAAKDVIECHIPPVV